MIPSRTVDFLERQRLLSLLPPVVMTLWVNWKEIQVSSLRWFRSSINQMQSRSIQITILSSCPMRLTEASMVFSQIIWWSYCRRQHVLDLPVHHCSLVTILPHVPLVAMFLSMTSREQLRMVRPFRFTTRTVERKLLTSTIQKSPIRFWMLSRMPISM